MSVILRTIEAFPKGRTTRQLIALLGADFNAAKREEFHIQLLSYQNEGLIVLGKDGKWRAARHAPPDGSEGDPSHDGNSKKDRPQYLVATVAQFSQVENPKLTEDSLDNNQEAINVQNLLRYYRAALQSDPRGSLTQPDDRHGNSYQLICGTGDPIPEPRKSTLIKLQLEHLPDGFREALIKRDSSDNALAVGWPISVGLRRGCPVIRPVGLIAATWQREATSLEVLIENDDLMVNPDWIKVAARRRGWSVEKLNEILTEYGQTGLNRDEFLRRLREAAATMIRGRLTGTRFENQLDPSDEGIFDALGLFLPTATTFTAGAVGDLDTIATWQEEKVARTALAPLLGLQYVGNTEQLAPVNLGPLNQEQINAAANAMCHPLSVVTGPPGTGKSQTIVSVAATALLHGNSVLVASKNHQALDAVQERLADIAPEINFMVRTLDPVKEIDNSILDVLKSLINEPSSPAALINSSALRSLLKNCKKRLEILNGIAETDRLRSEMANLVDRIERRKDPATLTEVEIKKTLWRRLLCILINLFMRKQSLEDTPANGASVNQLEQAIEIRRNHLSKIDLSHDPVELTAEIDREAKLVLKQVLRNAVTPTESVRISLSNESDDLKLHGYDGMSRTIAEAVLTYRPLWPASVLGTPKRIPLFDGLFDIAIIDESSQCDIASALPLLARAKRTMIVGDDKQLAFIPQIGVKQDRNLMVANSLPLRGTGRFSQGQKSLFDLARSVPDVPTVMLRDQYRSAAEIVDYINGEFYGGKLRVSADFENLKVPKHLKPGLVWTHVEAPSVQSHNKQNINLPEVKAITEEVKKLLVGQNYLGTIGVIAPFRPQVSELHEALIATIPPEYWKSAKLRVGTIDRFQGQERDLILFSPTVFAKINTSAVIFLQRDWRRMNVAISRARAMVNIFGDQNYAKSGAVKHLKRLEAHANRQTRDRMNLAFDSEWERIVYHKLRKRGLDPNPQYEVVGRRLDFALFGKKGVKLDLEIDGRQWHQDIDGNRKVSDLWRDHKMRSLGWTVLRFWVDQLHKDMEGCLDVIEQSIK